MVRLGAMALVWTCAPVSAEQADESAKLRKRLSAVEAELKQLRAGEGAPRAYREYRELQKEVNEQYQRHQKELKAPRDRMRKLSQKRGVQDWQRRISEKTTEWSRLRRELQSEIHKRGRELHERRRTELAKAAVAEAANARALGFTALRYPRVDGSTSTQPLGMLIACKMLGCPYRWAGTARYHGRWYTEGDSIDSSDLMAFQPMRDIESSGMRLGRGYYDSFSLIGYRVIAVPAAPASREAQRLGVIIDRMLTIHAGTHGAYENVINGLSDLGLVARRPSADELELAKTKGVELDVQPFALDAFVFITNYKNPVTNLSAEQIRGIYSGRLTNWKEAGGPDHKINAYQRNRNSGSQELMESLVMKDLPFSKPKHGRARTLIHHGMGGPYIALSHDRHGLAYSVYYYEHFMSGSPNTKLIAVDGVLPSYDTIRARQYPYVTEVYVVTRKGLQADSGQARFRAWLLSAEGQAVVRESGYVPLGQQQ